VETRGIKLHVVYDLGFRVIFPLVFVPVSNKNVKHEKDEIISYIPSFVSNIIRKGILCRNFMSTASPIPMILWCVFKLPLGSI
jgi:ABC-type polysaccharide transport system permease subunit